MSSATETVGVGQAPGVGAGGGHGGGGHGGGGWHGGGGHGGGWHGGGFARGYGPRGPGYYGYGWPYYGGDTYYVSGSCAQWSSPISNALLSTAVLDVARNALLSSNGQPATQKLNDGNIYMFTLESNQIVVRKCVGVGVAGLGQLPSQAVTYKVKSGDSFSSIAYGFTGNAAAWPELAKWNPGVKQIFVGQILRVPPYWVKQRVGVAAEGHPNAYGQGDLSGASITHGQGDVAGILTQPMGGGGSFVHSTSANQGKQVSRIGQSVREIGLGRAYPVHGSGIGVAPVPNLGSTQPSTDPIGKIARLVRDGQVGQQSTPLLLSTSSGTFYAADPSMSVVDATTAAACGSFVAPVLPTPNGGTSVASLMMTQAANIDQGIGANSTAAGTMPAGVYYISYNGNIYQFTKPASGATTLTGVCTAGAPAPTPSPVTPVVYNPPAPTPSSTPVLLVAAGALILGAAAAYLVSRPHKTPEEIAHEEAHKLGML